MSTPSFDINKLLKQTGMAAQYEASQARARMLDQITKVAASELGLKSGFTAVEYPAAEIGRGKLLFKPGQQLMLYIRGTMMGRSQKWEEGTEADFSFFIGRDVALIMSDRDDSPANRSRFLVHFNGFIEEIDG